LEIINVNFDATGLLLVICYAFINIWEKVGIHWSSASSICRLKKAYYWVRREIYNIFIDFSIPV